MRRLASMTIAAMISVSASAADCVLTIDRTPCPGKVAAARRPYAGVNPTREVKKNAADAATCAKEAENAAKIIRKGTLSAKKVTAVYGGVPVGRGRNFVDQAACR